MAIISLNGVAVVGAGTSLPSATPSRDATMFVTASPGSQAVVALEGTVDGTNWETVGVSTSSGEGFVNTRPDGPFCSAFRANLKSIASGTVTASVLIGQGSGGGGAAVSAEWVRPADWPAMPASVAEGIEILAAVTDDGSNFCAVNATVVGGYTVDWGDGVVENVASALQRDHKYTYTDVDLGPVTSRGYKTAIIRIYPQAAAAITAFDLGQKNATAGLGAYSNPWLDIQINAPSAVTMSFRSGVDARWVERINIVAIGAVTTFSSMFNGCQALHSLTFPAGSLASLGNMSNAFLGCASIPVINFPAGSLGSVTSIASAFSGCASLLSMTFPDGALAIVNAMNLAFNGCGSLQSVIFPAGSLSQITTAASAFAGCLVLPFVDFPAGALDVVADVANMFSGCASLQRAAFPAGSLDAVTLITNMFLGCKSASVITFPAGAFGVLVTTTAAFATCTNLERIINCSIPVSFALPCNLAATELDEIYTALPVVVGQTITVTGNWGVATDTPTIATTKGWTVTG